MSLSNRELKSLEHESRKLHYDRANGFLSLPALSKHLVAFVHQKASERGWHVEHRETYFRGSGIVNNRRWIPEKLDVHVGGYHLIIEAQPEYYCRISSQFISDSTNVSRTVMDYVKTSKELNDIFSGVNLKIDEVWNQQIIPFLVKRYDFSLVNAGQLERIFTLKKPVKLDAAHLMAKMRLQDSTEEDWDIEKIRVQVCPCFFGKCIAMIFRKNLTANITLSEKEIFSMEQLNEILVDLYENPEMK